MMRSSSACLLIGLWLTVTACDPKPCDDGYAVVHGVCIPTSKPALSDAGTRDAAGRRAEAGAAPEAGNDAVAPTGSPYRGFGDVCKDGEKHSDCTLDANFCAKTMATDETGACTRIECLDDLDMCPTDWACCDIGDLVSGDEPFSVCLAMEIVPEFLQPKCRR